MKSVTSNEGEIAKEGENEDGDEEEETNEKVCSKMVNIELECW